MDWLIVFIGIVIGAVVTAYVFCRNFVGTLRVDQSDPTDGSITMSKMNVSEIMKPVLQFWKIGRRYSYENDK